MKKYLLSSYVLVLLLAGCAAQRPLQSKEATAPMTPEQFAIEYAMRLTDSSKPEKIRDTVKRDESESFRHTQIHFSVSNVPPVSEGERAKSILSWFQNYCEAWNGKWTAERRSGKCDGGASFQLNLTPYSVVLRGPLSGTFYWWMMDLFQPKSPGRGNILDEYRKERIHVETNHINFLGSIPPNEDLRYLQFDAYVKRDFPAEKANRKAEQADLELRRQEAKQRQIDREVAASPYMTEVKAVGTKICRTFAGVVTYLTRSQSAGVSAPTTFLVTAFTEHAANSKIQLRISGVQSSSVPATSFEWGGNDIRAGAVIWDEPQDWRPCR